MNGGPSGFNNAPITRTLVVVCVLFTIFFGIRGRSNKLGLSYQDIWKKLQLWKLIVSVLTSILYLSHPALSVLTSGPYGLIFSSFIPFFFDIPVTTRFRVSSLSFSDKSFIYAAGLQLLLSSWKRSLIPGLCGILAGSLYHSNVLRIRRLKFPEFIASFFSRLSFPSVGSTSSAPPPARNAPSFAARQVEGNYRAPVLSAQEPPEDSIATLVSMGFDRNSARQALVHARNDINAATNILLESQSH
nr:rhomboid-like protein 20 [Tanacetum cinerariifolium]